jgi:hypothetical protein
VAPPVFKVSWSGTGGYLNQATPPTPLQLQNYLTGWSVDWGFSFADYPVGVDFQYSVTTRAWSTSAGLFTTQAGVAGTKTWEVQ